jgi:hypothetical protein
MIDRYKLLEKNPKLSEKVFGLEYTLLKSVLQKVQILYQKRKEENLLSKRGLKADFSLENQFLLTLEYLKTYQTFDVLGFSYGIQGSYASKCFHKILDLLVEVIGLKNTKKISFQKVKKAIIDVSCQPIERPQKNQKESYNAHKKTMLLKLKS